MRVMIKRHEESGLWVASDGHVILPPSGHFCKFRLTFGSKDKNGYMEVGFMGKKYKVHRLIAETFLSNPNGYPTVDHINRVKTANFVDNLRFADRKLQNNNRQICEDSLAKYGVRRCEDRNGYYRARYAKDPEVANRENARCREWRAQQRELGRHYRTLPDGSRQWLTDEEYNARFGSSQQLPLF